MSVNQPKKVILFTSCQSAQLNIYAFQCQHICSYIWYLICRIYKKNGARNVPSNGARNVPSNGAIWDEFSQHLLNQSRKKYILKAQFNFIFSLIGKINEEQNATFSLTRAATRKGGGVIGNFLIMLKRVEIFLSSNFTFTLNSVNHN